eukprot:242213-Amphidinium_carterae.1
MMQFDEHHESLYLVSATVITGIYSCKTKTVATKPPKDSNQLAVAAVKPSNFCLPKKSALSESPRNISTNDLHDLLGDLIFIMITWWHMSSSLDNNFKHVDSSSKEMLKAMQPLLCFVQLSCAVKSSCLLNCI